jgi:3',5'-cyclic-AMP phosphodiesterase
MRASDHPRCRREGYTMKIIQVTDLHLPEPGTLLFGLDPVVRLEICIDHINRNHADADLVVMSGDLANDGERAAYVALKDTLAKLRPPCRLMLGNHDDRDLFLDVFDDVVAQDGYVQASIDLADGRIILLDTLDPGHIGGRLCAARLDWLDRQLGDAGARPAYVFLHHPPFRIGMPDLDRVGLANPDDLHAVMTRHGNVRHIFAGHVHRVISGTWRGIPFTTVRGTNHQSALTFADEPTPVRLDPPAYAVALIKTDVVVHFHDFLDLATQKP